MSKSFDIFWDELPCLAELHQDQCMIYMGKRAYTLRSFSRENFRTMFRAGLERRFNPSNSKRGRKPKKKTYIATPEKFETHDLDDIDFSNWCDIVLYILPSKIILSKVINLLINYFLWKFMLHKNLVTALLIVKSSLVFFPLYEMSIKKIWFII